MPNQQTIFPANDFKPFADQHTKPPKMFQVLMHNDDYTSQDFVVAVLRSIFRKSGPEAQRIMLKIHTQGIGVAGTYTLDIAETKIAQVHALAKQRDFPLRCTCRGI